MGTLQLVATPIGNLEDVTLRALRTLAEADLLFAEDTRRTRILLDRHEIRARPVSLHEHNEASRIESALSVLKDGGNVALVSDAGTPLISDPGARLVEAAIAEGHRVESIPGASAPISALTLSGLARGSFSFHGFLPRRGGERQKLLEGLSRRPETLVFFESPRRIGGTLRELAEFLGNRRACVARELTKLHEEVGRGTLLELAERFAAEVRGEITLVVDGADKDAEGIGDDRAGEVSREEIDAMIRDGLGKGRRAREIAAQLAKETGCPRRFVYRRVLEIKEER